MQGVRGGAHLLLAVSDLFLSGTVIPLQLVLSVSVQAQSPYRLGMMSIGFYSQNGRWSIGFYSQNGRWPVPRCSK